MEMAQRKWIYVIFKGKALDREELMDVFRPFGDLIVGQIVGNHHAYVKFRNEEIATRAAATMNGCVIDGKGPIQVDLARPLKKTQQTVPDSYGRQQSDSTAATSVVSRNTPSLPKETPTNSNVPLDYFKPITEDMLREIHPFALKDMLAARLLPLIACFHPELADKLTGMIVELDSTVVLKLIEDSNALKGKVEEAAAVLHDFRDRRRAAV